MQVTQCLLFVAAGAAQAPLINAVSALGFRVVAMDQNPSAAGFEFSHRHFVADIVDAREIVRVARECGANGIMCISCDAAMPAVVEACQILCLPSLSPAMVEMSTSKVLQRKALVEAGLRTPWHVVITEPSQVVKLENNRPSTHVVVKPADSSGSRGVSLVSATEALGDAVARAMEYSDSGEVLVESFIEGNEYSIEAWVSRGQITVLGCSEKMRTQPPYLLDREVHFPPAICSVDLQSLEAQARLAIMACGYDNGPVHVECILSPEGPIIVELAARGGGFRVFSEILQRVSGVNIAQACIDTALGQRPVLESTLETQAASLVFIDPVPGRLTQIIGLEEARGIDNVADISIYPEVGDEMRELRSGADRAGHIIAYATSPEHCRNAAYLAVRKIQLITNTSINAAD